MAAGSFWCTQFGPKLKHVAQLADGVQLHVMEHVWIVLKCVTQSGQPAPELLSRHDSGLYQRVVAELDYI